MHIRLIRNATMQISYAGYFFITDPFLAAKHSIRSFADKSPNPLVDLPCPPEEAIANAEMALISHLHIDHFDPLAQEMLPKGLPIFCQPGDEDSIKEHGFQDVTPISDSVTWEGVTITRTPGQHGSGQWAERMGKVSGFLLEAAGEPTVYWMGDTIWYPAVEQVIADHHPDLIVTHSSGARFGDDDPIVMDAAQTVAVCEAAPDATVIAIHMDTLDHGSVTRVDLRSAADRAGLSLDRLLIPADGDRLHLS